MAAYTLQGGIGDANSDQGRINDRDNCTLINLGPWHSPCCRQRMCGAATELNQHHICTLYHLSGRTVLAVENFGIPSFIYSTELH